MQEYFSTSFLIKLNNDQNILKNIKYAYLHIQLANKQNIFTSTKKRDNTFISYYNEEGFIFNEEDVLMKSLKVNIYEYQMEDSDQNDSSDKQEQKNDIWEKESLFGFTSITLNQFSSKIYSAANPKMIIGEFIYTIKPYSHSQSPAQASCQWATPKNNKNLDKSNNLALDSSYYPNSSNKAASPNSSSLTDSNSCRGAEPYTFTENILANNKQQLETSYNQMAHAKSNFQFLKLLNSQNEQQNQFQNEEDSTETPTSKLMSSQGDLSPYRQQTPVQSMAKSTALPNNKEEKFDLSPNRLITSQKQKQFQEILTPMSTKDKSQTSKNSPLSIPQNKSFNTANRKQEQTNTQNSQQLQTFSQYLVAQQKQNNPLNSINKINNQHFNQYQQSPVYTPHQQMNGNNYIQPYQQISTSQYQNQLQNRIIHPQNNIVYQNNQSMHASQNISTPQHRIYQQQSPFSQPLQNTQILQRNSAFAPAPMHYASAKPQLQQNQNLYLYQIVN